jgi:hypothetical protein
MIMQQNQLQTIDNEQFGQMINLPNILQENRKSTTGATLATNQLNEKFSAANILDSSIQQLDALDSELNSMQVKLEATIKKQEEKRKPYTGFFDTVRSLFTAEEKAVGSLAQQIKNNRAIIAAEKNRRDKIAKAEQQKAIDKKNEEISIRATIREQYHAFYSNWSFNERNSTRDRFYAIDINGLNTLKSKGAINTYPCSITFSFNESNVRSFHHTQQEVLAILTQEVAVQNNDEYKQQCIDYFNSLIDLIPSRIMELERIANDAELAKLANARIEAEKQAAELEQQQQTAFRQQAIATEATAETLEATFDTIATTEVIEQAKGVKIKQKYKPVNHAGHIAILQWWVSNIMPSMSVEDLQTKLSFMRTAADKALNEGTTIKNDGLEIIEDIKTRGVK